MSESRLTPALNAASANGRGRHVGVDEAGRDTGLVRPLPGGGEAGVVDIDTRHSCAALGELDGQPAAPAADIEHRRRVAERRQDLGKARRRPPALGHDAFTPPM
jgi:hypothetical protein